MKHKFLLIEIIIAKYNKILNYWIKYWNIRGNNDLKILNILHLKLHFNDVMSQVATLGYKLSDCLECVKVKSPSSPPVK